MVRIGSRILAPGRLLGVALLVAVTGARGAEPQGSDVAALVSLLGRGADAAAGSESVRADFQAFVARHRLAGSEDLFRDYVRVRVVFEATRAGGWLRLRWDVTDREPRSDDIWHAWRALDTAIPRITANAECDELSALAAFLARRLGVRRVGLFWPRRDHTVAVWTAEDRKGGSARVVLPTSQVFLPAEAGFDTDRFDPGTQRVIHDYLRADVDERAPLPAPFLRFAERAIGRYAEASDRTQNALRDLRSRAMQSGVSEEIRGERATLERRLAANGGSPSDLAAVRAIGEELREMAVAPVLGARRKSR